MGAALAAGHADLEGREAAVKDAERRLATQQAELAALHATASTLQQREAELAAKHATLEAAASEVAREQQGLARERLQLQEADVRLGEARQRLEAQQAEAATTGGSSRAGSPGGGARPAPPPASEPSEGALSLSAPVTLNDRQHRTAAALLGSLGQTTGRGRERLARLERVLGAIAADAAEPHKVQVAYAAMSALGHELLELQASQGEFAAALEVVGTRGELLDVKHRLEGHQALLTTWEEKVARQLERIGELQSPTKRNSMVAASASAAARGGDAALRMSRAVSLAAAGASGEMVGGAAPIASGSNVDPAAAAAAAGMHSSAFGSSFSSASFAAGLAGALGAAASAPSSPALWDKAAKGGAGAGARRSAFTPGPALTGMGDASPVTGATPR
jgi:hypothetical protein